MTLTHSSKLTPYSSICCVTRTSEFVSTALTRNKLRDLKAHLEIWRSFVLRTSSFSNILLGDTSGELSQDQLLGFSIDLEDTD